jgi:hypothetical protein
LRASVNETVMTSSRMAILENDLKLGYWTKLPIRHHQFPLVAQSRAF